MSKEQFEQLQKVKDELSIAVHKHFYECIALLDSSLQELYEKEIITDSKCTILVKEMHYDIFFYRTQIFFNVPDINSPWISHIPTNIRMYTLYDEISMNQDHSQNSIFFKDSSKDFISLATYTAEDINWKDRFNNIDVFNNYSGWNKKEVALSDQDSKESRLFLLTGNLSKDHYTSTLMHLLDPQEKIKYLKERLEKDLPASTSKVKMKKI